MNLLRQASFNGLIAFGMTCVILSDGIDLSVGSTFALSAIICAELIMNGVPAGWSILLALVTGTLLGAISGVLVTIGRLQPFIATLITMTGYRGLALIITGGKPISRLAGSIESESGSFLFKVLGKGNLVFGPNDMFAILIPAIILVLALVIFYYVLHHTTFGRKIYATGKGMNQSMALAKAGVDVYHGGMIGGDGHVFLDACDEYGVHANYIKPIEGKTGHTIIQVDKDAQNSILLYGGANMMLTKEYVDDVLSHFDSEDILLLQNEVNMLPYIIDKAYEKGMQIALNPSPFNDNLKECDLTKISIFLLNEIEGAQVTGKTNPEEVLQKMQEMYPNAKIVLTLGKDGAIYAENGKMYHQPIFKVKAVDTTAAGDTFTGYFLAGLVEGMEIPDILRMSAKASSIAVTRPGAVQSIPYKKEVLEALAEE